MVVSALHGLMPTLLTVMRLFAPGRFSVSGSVTAKWKEVQEINTKTKTTGTVKKTGTEDTTGKVKTTGTGTVKGTETTDKVEVEQSAGVDQTASGGRSVGVSKEKTKAETQVERKTVIDEKSTGTNTSDATTTLNEKHKSEADMTGTDTPNYDAYFLRADLRVRLTGEKGRYNQTSEPGQRGGGGTDRPTQQKGGQP